VKLALRAVVFAFSFALFSIAALAAPALGEQAKSSLDALEKASKYSFDTGGIGILIRYGSGNGEGVTPVTIGDQFVKEFQRRGVSAKYFFYNADWRGMTVEYHIMHSAMGPWGVDEAASNVSKAAERAKAAQRIHGK
jgi:hypothetical protein